MSTETYKDACFDKSSWNKLPNACVHFNNRLNYQKPLQYARNVRSVDIVGHHNYIIVQIFTILSHVY